MHLWPLRERPRTVREMPRRGMRVRSVREADALTAIEPGRFWEDGGPSEHAVLAGEGGGGDEAGRAELTGGVHASIRVQVRELRERLRGDADPRGASQRKSPMPELRKREGHLSADGLQRQDLAEELKTKGVTLTGLSRSGPQQEESHAQDYAARSQPGIKARCPGKTRSDTGRCGREHYGALRPRDGRPGQDSPPRQ